LWEKPDELMTNEERANDTHWREYKIWDGRAFYHNKETKVSCWSMPPELRKLRGESSGIDDRPLPQTNAEKRRIFWDLMKEKGMDDSWSWNAVAEALRDEPLALNLNEAVRKQCFAELVGFQMRKKQIEGRQKDRNAASALERLIEERFPNPEDLGTTYEEASRILASEEAWGLIKSDVRRDEVFQTVMERMEDKHKKARIDSRANRIVRLQRLMASDPELTRSRLRWNDAAAILSSKDEIQEEQPPLDALRVWASLQDLKPTSEHDAEAKAKALTPDVAKAFRDERKRRDALAPLMKDWAIRGTISANSSWSDFEAVAKADPRLIALQDGPGATAMELFEEFLESLRRDGPELVLGVVPGSAAAEAIVAASNATIGVKEEEQPRKRQRTGFSEGDEPKQEVMDEDNTNALDALIAGPPAVSMEISEAPVLAAAPMEEEAGEEEEDPFAEVVTRAAAEKEKRVAAEQATVLTSEQLSTKKVDDLKQLCRDRGLPVSGRKQELVDRLLEAGAA